MVTVILTELEKKKKINGVSGSAVQLNVNNYFNHSAASELRIA